MYNVRNHRASICFVEQARLFLRQGKAMDFLLFIYSTTIELFFVDIAWMGLHLLLIFMMFIFRVSLSLSFINVILTTAYAHACRELTDRDSKDLSKAPSVSIRNDYGPTSPSYARDVRIQTHARRTPVENLTNRNTENNLLLRRVLSPEEVQHWIKFAQKATLEDRDGHLAFQRSYQENPRLLEPQVHHTAANHDANMATIRRWKIQLATKVAELQRHGRLKEATEYKTAMLQYIETKEKSQLGIASMSKGAIHKALSLIEGGSTHKGSNKESSSSGRSGSTRIRRSGVEDLEKIDEERKHREIQRRGNMLSMKLDNLSPEEIGSWIRVAKDAAQKSQNDQKCMERYYGQPRERRPKGFVAKSQADHLLEMATIFPKVTNSS